MSRAAMIRLKNKMLSLSSEYLEKASESKLITAKAKYAGKSDAMLLARRMVEKELSKERNSSGKL